MAELPSDFESFLDAVRLPASIDERLEAALRAMDEVLVDDGPCTRLVPQGSWPAGTAVRPINTEGEYDLDLVAILDEPPDDHLDAIAAVEDRLAEHGTYADRLVSGKPCVRLDYADDMHVDIVAARDTEQGREIALRQQGWKKCTSQDFVEWCLQQGEAFQPTVLVVKRWRDLASSEKRKVNSTTLQALIGEQLASATGDARRLTETLENLDRYLQGFPDEPPKVANPVDPSEDLAERWPAGHYRSFRSHVATAAGKAREALDEADPDESRRRWRDLLGEDFPAPAAAEAASTPPGWPTHQPSPRRGPQRHG